MHTVFAIPVSDSAFPNCYNEVPAVGIAQLAEHWTVAPAVAGSIPVSHPRFWLEIVASRTNAAGVVLSFLPNRPRHVFITVKPKIHSNL